MVVGAAGVVVGGVVVVLTVVVALITTALRSRHDPAWREVLTAVGLAALAALATQGLQAQLPANVAFPVTLSFPEPRVTVPNVPWRFT